MEMDNGTYYMKPMNCPMHCLIFRSRQRSYRELPLRLFELGTVYRYERAGTLHGLMRIRGFTQDDSHIFCTPEQAADEIASLLDFVLSVLRAFGFDDFTFNLSTKDPNKYVGTRRGLGGGHRGAARGARPPRPRVRDQGGRRRVLRAEDRHRRPRRHRPHAGSCRRSSTTSTSPSASSSSTSAPTTPGTARSCSTAPCSGRSSGSSACSSSTTPAPSRRGWRRCRCACCRSPTAHEEYAEKVADRVRAAGGRVDVVGAGDPLGKRIRAAKLEKLPYILVVGDDDVAAGTVGVNRAGQRQARARRRPRRRSSSASPTRSAAPTAEALQRLTPRRCSSGSGTAGGRRTSRAAARPAGSPPTTSASGRGSVFTPHPALRAARRRHPHRPPRRRTCFAILNAFPYSVGHLLVLPYREVGELEDARRRRGRRAVGDRHRRRRAP